MIHHPYCLKNSPEREYCGCPQIPSRIRLLHAIAYRVPILGPRYVLWASAER